jgi:hypothetical protein
MLQFLVLFGKCGKYSMVPTKCAVQIKIAILLILEILSKHFLNTRETLQFALKFHFIILPNAF